MNCASCGVQNVEFATTCYSCGHTLGSRVFSAPASTSASTHTAPEVPTARPSAFRFGGLARFLFFIGLIVWFFREPLQQLQMSMDSTSEAPSEAPSEIASEPEPAAPADEAAPADAPEERAAEPAAPSQPAVDEYPADEPATEINGFTMKEFAWILPEGRADAVVRFGEVVRGRSEITGFEVSDENRIDVTMTFAFRDPRGKLVEPSSQTRLDQPVESDTLFSSFDYTIPKKGPAGDYELTIGVDDAVSGRSVRFRRTIKAER